MCEIFFLYGRNDQINPDSLEKLLKTALQAAHRNSDGFGIFNEKKQSFKTAKKLKNGHIPNLVNQFADSKFVVIHLRLATTGSVCKANSHPFRHNNDMLVHNGVVRGYNNYEKDRADSYHMLRQIVDERSGGDTVQGIQDAMNDISGRVSVFMHDKNHDLYYFRDGSKFTFAHNPVTNEYVGATDGDKLNDVWDDNIGHVPYFDNLNKKDPEEGNILKITDENIKKVATFDMDNYTSNKGYWKSSRRTSTNKRRQNQSGSQTDSSQTTSDEELQACCVLREEDVSDNQSQLPNPPSSSQISEKYMEDSFNETEYQRQKTGFTDDEWEDYVQSKARQYEPDTFEDLYGIESEVTGIPPNLDPNTVAQEVYEEENIDLTDVDEQEYWEQKEQEFFQEMDDRYHTALEEEDKKLHPLEAENEGRTVEQDIDNGNATGLQALFEGSTDDE